MGKALNLVTNAVSFCGNLGLGIYGEHLQRLATWNVIEYHPIMGYLSDLTGAAGATSFYMLITSLEKLDDTFGYAGGGLLGLTFTGMELCSKYMPSETYDPRDIGAYWAGIGVACGIHHLTKKRENNLEDKL